MTGPKILVTGASGFVGEALVFRLLVDKKYCPVAAVRSETRLGGLCSVQMFDLLDEHSSAQLEGIEVIVHAAARVHVMDERADDALTEFRKVNVQGTLKLARQAVASGVRRFIYISSIKVNGENTLPGRPFKADDPIAPQDPYGVSKHEAETALMQLGHESGMEVVVIRPPLVYGPGVKANFLSMMDWLSKGIPLPLGAIGNQRSLVAIANLVSLIVACIDHPAAANQVFLVSDGDDVSTSRLLRRLATALGKPSRLLPVPESLLKLGAGLLGKRGVSQRICGSLQVDIEKNLQLLGWTPPVSMQKALRQTAERYKDEHG
ncbi:UDP-glucose 4-epimerase family protein [Pseudomonas fluorescens]|uniref:UDP-glucose 4-epimerase family protein n=1 Tax=Pseudomonas fluorescens TaxID=294 RepID=UPI00259AF3DF|nr:SDR family oxidoreductase [Pseudomonas fluorescens]WJK08346.1 SDR family oxidoreductase [Pseudomonas fluorescens]